MALFTMVFVAREGSLSLRILMMFFKVFLIFFVIFCVELLCFFFAALGGIFRNFHVKMDISPALFGQHFHNLTAFFRFFRDFCLLSEVTLFITLCAFFCFCIFDGCAFLVNPH